MPIEKITVLGQGLAGTLASFELWRQKREFTVIDDGNPEASSRAACGLFAPVTGQRTALMWKAEELLAAARDAYRALESELGVPFLYEMPLMRIFTDAEQKDMYLKRAKEDSHRPYLGPWLKPDYFKNLGLSAPFGGMEVRHAGRLDVQALLSAWRAWLQDKRLLQVKAVPASPPLGGRVLDCRGLGARQDPGSAWIRFQPAKGETLKLRARGPGQGTIYYGRHFAIPLGNNKWRVGATYDRADASPKPTAPKRSELEAGSRALFGGGIEVESQDAGLRPNVQGHFPVIGPQKSRPGHFVFNGLGSKGVLWAPWGAKILTRHIFERGEIPHEVHSERFYAQDQEEEKEASPA